jgi:hypothetical protein
MVQPYLPRWVNPAPRTNAIPSRSHRCRQAIFACAIAIVLTFASASAQVITIDTKADGPLAVSKDAPVDHRYAQITPTTVPLPNSILDPKTRLELIRLLQAEQGFAMRPLPRGHKGLTLVANGKLEPAGEAYLNMIVNSGTSAKPGDRVVVTDVKIENNKIVFLLNGGPDLKHRFLRHIEIGADPNYSHPVAQDDGQEPVGSRLTLDFQGHLPALTGAQVKALLAPLISFDVKTPVQAYTDTLPSQLKAAILNHQVLVGMSTDMVTFSKGQPKSKSREMDGQMPFEEWIYGTPPQEVDFVRINGNRVIRVEIAKMGEPPTIFTQDVVAGMLRTDGTPLETAKNHVHITKEGDVTRDPDKEAPNAPPSLRTPSEQHPTDPNATNAEGRKNADVMRPVQAPVKKPEYQKPDYQPGANADGVPATPDTAPAAESSPAPAKSQSTPATTSQPN